MSLFSLFSQGRPARAPRKPASARLSLEALEDRTVPSFVGPVNYPAGDGASLLSAGDFNQDGSPGAATGIDPLTTNGTVQAAVDTENHFATTGAGVLVNPLPAFPEFPPPFALFSGVLIHPRVMLTAGHAVAEIELAMAAGQSTLDDGRISFSPNAHDPASWIEIEAVLKHPDYNSRFTTIGGAGNGLQDVGVIILKTPVTHVAPTPLPEPFVLDRLNEAGQLRGEWGQPSPFRVVGYGAAFSFPPPDTAALVDGLRRVDQPIFQALRPEWLLLSQNAAQGLSGTTDHDSGAPVFWVDPATGVEHLVALGSRADIQRVSLGAYVRLDDPDVLAFLQDVIGQYGDGGSDGTFPAVPSFATSTSLVDVAVGDFNRDGWLDVVTANYEAGTFNVLLGDEDGTFRLAQTFAAGSEPNRLEVGDLGGDGWLDLAVIDLIANGVVILLNDGSW
ncbi:MAG: FG-GAP-like repeat-containing protein [Gemmataceae bacterium]|nr:FG-GAP-like repeat-containing protein [Gemmataceae bacterium]